MSVVADLAGVREDQSAVRFAKQQVAGTSAVLAAMVLALAGCAPAGTERTGSVTAGGVSGTAGGAAAGGDGAGGSTGGAAAGGAGAGGSTGGAASGGQSGRGGAGAGGRAAEGGRYLVAIDTPRRTYLDYVDVPAQHAWTPEVDGWPELAQWEQQTVRTGMRFQRFTPGDVLTPSQITALLPSLAVASHTVNVAAYGAQAAPGDATAAIQAALNAAGAMANADMTVDVLIPAGTYNFSTVLVVPHDVRLRRWPEDTGGVLHASNPSESAVHLAGDRSGALFLLMTSPATMRTGTPWSGGIWVGGGGGGVTSVTDTVVVGNDVSTPESAHVFALGEHGGLWAFNFAHDGYADTFHHTGASSFCQVVGNRAQTSSSRGDDLYAFVGYAHDGDPVHHCTCIANWGRDGHARGLSAVGAGFIFFQSNDIARTQAAGAYLGQEDSYSSFGSFDIRLTSNIISQANLASTHDGVLVFSSSPDGSDPSTTFGTVDHRVQRVTLSGNVISDTAPGLGNGWGIEIRSSADQGDVSGNILVHNRAPQIVVNGTNFTVSSNTLAP